jgi:dTDP-glucose 4,6-dehydratase
MPNKLKILVTGGAGFIGSEFVRQGVAEGYDLAVTDNLTYAGDISRLKLVAKQFTFYKADVTDKTKLEGIIKKEKPQAVVHFAAETHVDRSIQNAHPFIETNVTGTQNIIDLVLKYKIPKFIHFSTDEVYGEIAQGKFKEDFPLNPSSPYSATKAAADMLIKAAIRTHHLPAIIVRPSNNYGPWQYPEKFLPVILLKSLHNEKIPVYGDGSNVREWLHVSDCVAAINLILEKGKIGEIYNIGSNTEKKNIEVVKAVLNLLNKPESLIEFVHDRPGHDIRYSVDCTKLQSLGWKTEINFDQGLKSTVQWALEHQDWLEGKLKYLRAYWKKVYKKK